ncbi:MAG TPA: class I lanthipeptide [Chitinophaga sp.]|uniref:class I lanthipeptide n=1 Tax=Chitinophaga sp. TaxID=1869181 RepID=UPI002C799003|nr:class I lanthipeptide [Chitinophaga sp.]HVI48075.1 class I lanthipeptide [Chitinophaga sp.]
MKKKKVALNKKLVLNKEMIAVLNNMQQERLAGGIDTRQTCGNCTSDANPTRCATDCNTHCPNLMCN